MLSDITPMATLYHWDHPQAVEDRGGWLSNSTIAPYVLYARKCFEQLGQKVRGKPIEVKGNS